MLGKDLEVISARLKQNNEESKNNILAKIPEVGLFWFHKNRILPMSKPWRELYPDSQGVLDYPDSHYNVWSKFQRIHPELAHYEYDEVQRGRVVCKINNNVKIFVAIIPKELKNNEFFKRSLLNDFNLPASTEWEVDEHYSNPADIDWGNED